MPLGGCRFDDPKDHSAPGTGAHPSDSATSQAEHPYRHDHPGQQQTIMNSLPPVKDRGRSPGGERFGALEVLDSSLSTLPSPDRSLDFQRFAQTDP
jgi:hypothetical protein